MTKKKMITNIVVALISIVVVAALGSILVYLGMSWFDGLRKPTEWIPNFVIPLVWTIVYLTFGVILFLWLKQEELETNVFVLLIINGALNILWCLVFFTFEQLFLGNVVLIINMLFAVKLIFAISRVRYTYSLILSIYPIWLSIATTLNIALWILN